MHYEESNPTNNWVRKRYEEIDPQTPSEKSGPILKSVPDNFDDIKKILVDEITTDQEHNENFDAAVDAFLEYYCDPDNPEYIFGESKPEEN